MPKKKKQSLPVFSIVEMPKWKSRILDVITSILFPGEKYFVLTINETDFTYDGVHYYDLATGEKII